MRRERIQAARRESGVTLLELLVSVSLVGLLAVGMAFALRVSLNGSAKAQQRITEDRKVFGVERILREEVGDLIPALTVCRSESSPRIPTLLFEGTGDSMRFVSAYSLAEAGRGRPRLLEFKVIPGSEGNGVRLVVNERLYTGLGAREPVCTGVTSMPNAPGQIPVFTPIEIGSFSFVLADKLAYCRILYQEPRPAPEVERWVPRWLRTDIWPTAIRVEMAPLSNTAPALQLSTVTVPLRINREPYTEYHE